MRTKLVEHDVVECVLGLGPNLFYNSPMEACVMVCRMNKPLERQGRVLFINAVKEVTRERAQSFLEEDHIHKIFQAYQDFQDIDGFAKVATFDDIQGNQANLSIPLYVRPSVNSNGARTGEAEKQLSVLIQEWEQSSQSLRKSISELFKRLTESV